MSDGCCSLNTPIGGNYLSNIYYNPFLLCIVTSINGFIISWMIGSYTRLSCTLIKWNLKLAKIGSPQIQPFYPIPLPPTEQTNWPINDVHVSNLNWWQFSPCHTIHVYSISYIHLYIYRYLCSLWRYLPCKWKGWYCQNQRIHSEISY